MADTMPQAEQPDNLILQAIARGWCAPECAGKVTDPILAFAIEREVRAAIEAMQRQGMTSTEALFGFMGWLTSREEAVTFGAKHEASTAVELIGRFIEANGLPADCRDDWTTRLTMPAAGGASR